MKKARERGFSAETFIFLAVLLGAIGYMCSIMGVGPMFKTLLNTAYSVLIDTVLYLCAMCVLMGAVSALFTEFGVVDLAQWLINPIMKPLYGMPGVTSLGVVSTFLSDNAAILALGQDNRIRRYYKKYQIPALCNIGTTFGMGMIVCTFMLGLGTEFVPAIIAGLVGCIVGSIFSTRSMLFLTKRHYIKQGTWEKMQEAAVSEAELEEAYTEEKNKKKEKRSVFSRAMNAMLEGGKLGWEICFQSTPGVVCICTLVMMLTFGPGTAADGTAAYTGAAYEGIELLPKIGDLIAPITKVLFGFKDGSNIVVPVTSLGAVGAAIGLVPKMVETGLAGANEIAVFTGIGMCWSGYLSTHISIMDTLGSRELIPQALITHTIAGLIAGVVAHYFFLLIA
ncbi:MAG: hypothetical protein GXY88_00295 [Tissierellia bacterium]|nr:hypothetical protein [Tissierellia bacterium]